LNPLRAGVTQGLGQLNVYPYSGHATLVGKKGPGWQDIDYVLRYFGDTDRNATEGYLSFIKEGIGQGRRNDLVGGGLIRSLRGWSEVKETHIKGQTHIMSDERILGDPGFVDTVLSQANERYDRHFELKRQGYHFNRIVLRVAEIQGVHPDEILSKGKQPKKVKARSLLCYWAVGEVGMSLTDVAKRLGMTVSGVGYAVQRGEAIVREQGYQLMVEQF